MDRYQINVLRYMNDGNPVTQINSTAGEYRIIATTLLVVGIIFGIAAVVLWFRFRIFHLFLMLSGIDARVSTDHTRDREKKHKHATKAVTAALTVHSETSPDMEATTVLPRNVVNTEADDEKTTVLESNSGIAKSKPGFRIEQDKVISN